MSAGRHRAWRLDRGTRGFTLLEVMIALAILGTGLAALLQAQAGAIDAGARARDNTIAALLARGKMIDLEQKLFDEGFTSGEQEESGDFTEEGYPAIRWTATIDEVELDLSMLTGMCEGLEGDGDGGGSGGASACSGLLGGIGAPFEALTSSIASSLRVVELVVRWPEGKNEGKLRVSGLVTRQDYNLQTPPPQP